MTIETLAPGVSLVTVALGDYDVRGVVLVGSDAALVWDTLSHPRDMVGVVPLLSGRGPLVVYSHADWDHCWGTAGLPTPARIVAHERCLARFDDDVPRTLAEKMAAEPGAWDAVTLMPPTATFTETASIDVGALTLELHHLPGHTTDCIVGLVPERGLLLAGDTVETPCPVVPPGAPLEPWVAALEGWAADARVVTVVPAHGAIGGCELLLQNATYLRGILAGAPVAPDGPLTPFYSETHAQNVRWRPSPR